jgi:hypothetical protein
MEPELIFCFISLIILCVIVAIEEAYNKSYILGEEWDFLKSYKVK